MVIIISRPAALLMTFGQYIEMIIGDAMKKKILVHGYNRN